MNLFCKDILRTIRASLGRFISIAAIIAIGVGIFIGLNASSPAMKKSMSEYLRQNNAYDLRVSCSYGLDNKSLDTLKNVEGVEDVMLSTSADARISVNDTEAAFTAYSLPDRTDQNTDNNQNRTINNLILIDGKWPAAADECVVIADTKIGTDINIGDTVNIKKTVMNTEQVFVTNNFKVVGHVYSPTIVQAGMIGYSTVTEGRVTGAIYLPEKSFSADYPKTDAWLKVSGADKFLTQSDEYNQYVNQTKEKVDSVLPSIAESRLSTIQSKLREDINSGQNKIDRGVAEMNAKFADGLNQLNDALNKLNVGKTSIEHGQQELLNMQSQLDQYKTNVYKELNQMLDQTSASIQICNQLTTSFNSTNLELNKYWADIQESLDKALPSYLPAQDNCNRQIGYCAKWIDIINSSPLKEQEKSSLINVINAYRQNLELIGNACRESHDDIEAAQTRDDKIRLYNQSLNNLQPLFVSHDMQVQAMNTVFAQINQSLNNTLSSLYQYQSQMQDYFNQAQAKIDTATSSLSAKKAEVDGGYLKQQEGTKEYNSSKASAEAKIAESQQKLNEGKNTIDAMSRPQLYLLDRTQNMSYVSYFKNSDSIANIAVVFPLFLLIIAALVSMSTMTRMVEEERTRMGTCKALGYSKTYIAGRYVCYGAVSAVIGALVGILVFAKLLPVLIIYSYNMMFSVPVFCVDYSAIMFLAGFLLGIFVTCGVTVLTVYKTTREVPAQLMRPPSPKKGKKILLERSKKFWKGLSFLWKISFRNIFLFKKRFIMTVIGIAGCTALIVTAFGLWDAIEESITYHNTRVAKETMQVTLPKDSSKTPALNNVITSKADTFANIQTTNIVIKSKDGTDQVVTLSAAQDNDSLDIMRPLHNRLSGQKMSFSKRFEHDSNYTDPDSGRNYKVRYLDGGIVISEKLANITGLMPGDTAKFTKQSFTGNSSDVEFEFTVAGITECYFGHYAYVNIDEYKAKVDPNVTYNKFLLKTNDKEKDQQIMSELKNLDDDVSITYNEDLTNTMRNTVESVKLVVIILIICAALLAFVVIYNLTNISISERLSELATLKVLGNTDKEVNAYVHRETLVLTVIGALVGLLLGSGLVMIIVQTTETDMMMMGRDIKAFSYVISIVLTVVFTLIVIFAMRHKIKNINMIESLKSVE